MQAASVRLVRSRFSVLLSSALELRAPRIASVRLSAKQLRGPAMPNERTSSATESRSIPLHTAIERDLDANYHEVPLAHPNRTTAIWYLLTVLEDGFRGLFALTQAEDAAVIEYQLDCQKYSVRFALDRIRRESTDLSNAPVPARVVPRLYLATAALLQAGVEFRGANQLCSAAHAGTVRFVECEDAIEAVDDGDHHDMRYTSLELLGHQPLDVVDHTAFLYAWTQLEQLRPPVVYAIARSTTIADQKVVYKYELKLAVELSKELQQAPSMIPVGWRFPWGGRSETTLLVNALCVRCVYHWIAVHFGAGLHRLRGGGEASLIHITSMSRLVDDMDAMCSLGEARIRRFVEYLTYGFAAKSPDPALQPLVKLTEGMVAVPCVLYLSSNYERNLLGLQARIDPGAFDRMSQLFEADMVRDLLVAIRPRWPQVKANVIVRDGGTFEEIDLLIADPQSRTLIACELRWMLQPGDPRDVRNRKTACKEKVRQLARKLEWLQPRLQLALDTLGISTTDLDRWNVEGVVVIKTFGGTLSPLVNIPVLTMAVFLQGIEHARSMKHFAEWSQSLRWLPQESLHFKQTSQTVALHGLKKKLTAAGIEKACSLRVYKKFVEQSLV
jgi:hypothetical protein